MSRCVMARDGVAGPQDAGVRRRSVLCALGEREGGMEDGALRK